MKELKTEVFQFKKKSQQIQDSNLQRSDQFRFIKYPFHNKYNNRITINISKCQYPILQAIAKQLFWKIDQNLNNTSCDVFWTDTSIECIQLFKMHDFQTINHFPGMYSITRKNFLGKSLMKFRKIFQQQYNFFPFTWMIPSQLSEFSRYYQICKQKQQNKIFIVKPQASSQGKGIFLIQNLQEIQKQPCIVQKYIQKPYLLNGLKFDFRIYVLLAGCDPLRIYIYKQGLVRFATKIYKSPQKDNFNQICMHLTNYSINKQNPEFVFNKNQNINVGHKRSLTSVFKILQKKGVNIKLLKNNINQIITKTIITGQPLLAHFYHLSQPENYSNNMCFQILGFDIILDENSTPRLLEVNHSPSFNCDSPLDETIKKNLLKESLLLMNINKKSKKEKIQRMIKKKRMRQENKKQRLNKQQKQLKRNIQQKKRDEYQNNNLGNFQKIYPTQDQQLMGKYQKYLNFSLKLFNQKNGLTKKNIVNKSKDNKLRICTEPKQFQKNILLNSTKRLPFIGTKKITEFQSQQLKYYQQLKGKTTNFRKIINFSENQLTGIHQQKISNSEILGLNKKNREKNYIQNEMKGKIGKYICPKLLQIQKQQGMLQLRIKRQIQNKKKLDRQKSNVNKNVLKKIIKVLSQDG